MKIFSVLSLLVTILLAGGCGGSSGSAPAPVTPPPVGGIGRTGLAFGPVTTFGSIVVNGVHYDTTSAAFTVNDVVGSQSDLSVGHVVLIKGTLDSSLSTGTADEVIFDDNVKGPVTSIDIALGQVVVLGQRVVVGPDTSFDDNISPASLEGLAIGEIVEVSGLNAADGSIAATRIESKPAGTPFEVHGLVRNHDLANFRFSINDLVVDYSSATLDNFAGGQITDGDFVEAKGAALNASGELTATKVELETAGIPGNDGDHVEVEGLITRFQLAQDFDIGGVAVVTNSNTAFTGGVAADLGLNVKLEVEGDLDANGVIIADKVDIRRARIIRAQATVDSVNSAANSLVMLGVTVSVDELTRIEDKSAADVDPLTINDISTGDYLEIRGNEIPAGSGQILAGLLERDDADTGVSLQGFVTAVNDPALTVLNVTIETNGGTVFRDIDDSVLTATDFFNLVGPDSLIKATGTESTATTITATEVELELEN